jgi:hypothetical protein
MTAPSLRTRMLRTLAEFGPMTTGDLTAAVFGPCTEPDRRKRAARWWEARWRDTYWLLDAMRLTGDVLSIPTATDQLWCTPEAAEALETASRRALLTWFAGAPVLEAL